MKQGVTIVITILIALAFGSCRVSHYPHRRYYSHDQYRHYDDPQRMARHHIYN